VRHSAELPTTRVDRPDRFVSADALMEVAAALD
jgi:hypothetical protein